MTEICAHGNPQQSWMNEWMIEISPVHYLYVFLHPQTPFKSASRRVIVKPLSSRVTPSAHRGSVSELTISLDTFVSQRLEIINFISNPDRLWNQTRNAIVTRQDNICSVSVIFNTNGLGIYSRKALFGWETSCNVKNKSFLVCKKKLQRCCVLYWNNFTCSYVILS